MSGRVLRFRPRGEVPESLERVLAEEEVAFSEERSDTAAPYMNPQVFESGGPYSWSGRGDKMKGYLRAAYRALGKNVDDR